MKKHFMFLAIVALVFAPMMTLAQQGQGNGQGQQSGQAIHEAGTGLTEEDTVVGQQAQQGIHEPGTGLEDTDVEPQSVGQQKQQGQSEGVEVEPVLYQQNQGSTSGQGQQVKQGQETQPIQEAVTRRSRVANAVQQMLDVADRDRGIGEQVRVIAQEQNQLMTQAETELDQIQSRSRVARFLIGPDYQTINLLEARLANHQDQLDTLKNLAQESTSVSNQELLQEQIEAMEAVKTEMEAEIEESQSGFSLFGWFNRLLNR